MGEITRDLNVGSKKYKIFCKLTEFKHLCTFLELSDLTLTIVTKDATFQEETYQSEGFSEIDYKIFALVLKEVLRDGSRGYLLSCGTGSRVCWDYMTKQSAVLLPFLALLPVVGEFVLYKTEGGYGVPVPGREEDAPYTELTMFNIDGGAMIHYEDVSTRDYIEEANSIEATATVITADVIKNYLGRNNAT